MCLLVVILISLRAIFITSLSAFWLSQYVVTAQVHCRPLGSAAPPMRLSCHSTRSLLLTSVLRPRLTARPCRLSFTFLHSHLLVGFRSAYLNGPSNSGISSAVQSSVSEMQRRSFASKINGPVAKGVNHDHHHGHKHSLFGGHEHEHEHGTDAEKVIEALKGGGELPASLTTVEVTLSRLGDRGSRITLIGLFANVGLTAAKGAAGW